MVHLHEQKLLIYDRAKYKRERAPAIEDTGSCNPFSVRKSCINNGSEVFLLDEAECKSLCVVYHKYMPMEISAAKTTQHA